MVRWRYTFIAAVLMAAACDNDSDPVLPDGRGAVIFDAYDDGATVTTENIQSFRVSAYTEPGHRLVMDNITVRRTGQNSWFYTPEVLWPGGDTAVSFTAITPPEYDITVNAHWHNTVKSVDSIGQSDICIAARYRVRPKDGRIRLNFRHTLARLMIMVRSSMPDKHVYLKELTLYNVCTGSTLFFPDETTAPDGSTLTSCWPGYVDDMANAKVQYFRSDSPGGIEIGDEAVDVSNMGNIFVVPFNPRPLEWHGYVSGTGFRLTCRICDSAGVQTWPDSSTNPQLIEASQGSRWGYIYFPISPDGQNFRWNSGYTYRYTLDIANRGTLPGQSSRSTSNTLTLEIL